MGGLPGRPYVLFLSRLHYKKGLDILADAFRRVAPCFPMSIWWWLVPMAGRKTNFASVSVNTGCRSAYT